MKLPPLAIAAPTLCPRCDQPSLAADHCSRCRLELRSCPACAGVAGPFDRFCGYCSRELVAPPGRPLPGYLGVAVAVVPVAALLVLGLTRLYTAPHTSAPGRQGSGLTTTQSQRLRFQFGVPHGWVMYDYSRLEPDLAQPMVVTSTLESDNAQAVGAAANLAAFEPKGTVILLERRAAEPDKGPPVVVQGWVDAQTSQPPSGTSVEVVQASEALTIGGLSAGEAEVRLTRPEGTYYVEDVYIQAPESAEAFQIQAVGPEAAWDARAVERIIGSVRVL